MSQELQYTEAEAMICYSARLIEDERSVFVGGGMPQLSMVLAQMLYAPSALQIYEYGVIGPRVVLPFERRLEMAGSKNNFKAIAWRDMNTVFFQSSTGLIDYGMLGVNETDIYGNINTTFIGGDFWHPKMRLTGSGGANEIASLCWKVITVLMHEKRRFVEKLDCITSPGFLDGSPRAREKAGLPRDTGPYRVVTSRALFGYCDETRKMKLLATYPGVSVDEVVNNMGFMPVVPDKVEELTPPTPEELRLLREVIDPKGLIIGKARKAPEKEWKKG